MSSDNEIEPAGGSRFSLSDILVWMTYLCVVLGLCAATTFWLISAYAGLCLIIELIRQKSVNVLEYIVAIAIVAVGVALSMPVPQAGVPPSSRTTQQPGSAK